MCRGYLSVRSALGCLGREDLDAGKGLVVWRNSEPTLSVTAATRRVDGGLWRLQMLPGWGARQARTVVGTLTVRPGGGIPCTWTSGADALR